VPGVCISEEIIVLVVKVAHAPPSCATGWEGLIPKNITESPELMVRVFGENAKPEMVIVSIVAFALGL
jgi:hypothetical protein